MLKGPKIVLEISVYVKEKKKKKKKKEVMLLLLAYLTS
jgi:hypothetical protein